MSEIYSFGPLNISCATRPWSNACTRYHTLATWRDIWRRTRSASLLQQQAAGSFLQIFISSRIGDLWTKMFLKMVLLLLQLSVLPFAGEFRSIWTILLVVRACSLKQGP